MELLFFLSGKLGGSKSLQPVLNPIAPLPQMNSLGVGRNKIFLWKGVDIEICSERRLKGSRMEIN